MRFIKLLIFVPISILLVSCSSSSDREKSLENTAECIEEKFDSEESKHKTIDEALTAYDFETARNLLGCYEDACFSNRTRENYCPEKYMETYKEWADKKSQKNPHFQMLYKIVQAEVTYFLNAGEYSRALTTVNESDMFFVYKDKLPSAINKWVDEKQYDLALRALSQFTFEESFNSKSYNYKYNKEVLSFNNMMSSLINATIFENDTEILKKCIILIKPIAVEDGKNYKLVNTPKENILAKIEEAGITL